MDVTCGNVSRQFRIITFVIIIIIIMTIIIFYIGQSHSNNSVLN